MDKKRVLILVLVASTLLSVLIWFIGPDALKGSGEGGSGDQSGQEIVSGTGGQGSQGGSVAPAMFGNEGNDRPVFLREIHVLLAQNGFEAGLGPLNAATDGKIGPSVVMSVEELATYIDVIGLTEDGFNNIISQYFAPSSGAPSTDGDWGKDTRPIDLGKVHSILVNQMGFADGLKPISPPYTNKHLLRVGALWPEASKLGLTTEKFEELISLYFDGSDSQEPAEIDLEDDILGGSETDSEIDSETGSGTGTDEVYVGGTLEMPAEWEASGEVFTDDLILTVFDLYGMDLKEYITDMPSTMIMEDFRKVVAEVEGIKLTDEDVYKIYIDMLSRGEVLNGNVSLLGGIADQSVGFASVEDEPSSTMSSWAVDGFVLFESYLPSELVELIRHNPRGHVSTAELNQIVMAMYEVSETPSHQAPQWPHSTVVRGEAIHVLVDAYLNILMSKGGDPLTVMAEAPNLEHFTDFDLIDASIFKNVSIAYSKKWMTGMSDTFLGVKENFERQQVIVIAYRILGDLGYV